MLPLSVRQKLPFRVIVCLDVDCFEEQVWRKHRYQHYPDNTPIVIVNPDNVVLSWGYSARAPKYGIKRAMSKRKLAKMQLKYRELTVLCTGTRNGRCDTFTPFKESDVIMDAVMRQVVKYRGVRVERASCDEIFLDITELLLRSWDWDKCASNDQVLLAKKRYRYCKEHDGSPKTILYSDATTIGQEIRNLMDRVEDSSEEAFIIQGGIFSELLLDEIYTDTGYYCSAGVGPNKLIAKVASGRNKPAGVAIITEKGFIKQTFSLPYNELPGLKRNTGVDMATFYEEKMGRPLKFVSQLQDLSFGHLREFYCNKGLPSMKAKNLYESVRGIDFSPVQHKLYNKSMGFSYTFRGSHRARECDVDDLASDMVERFNYLVEHRKRQPKCLFLRIEFETENVTREIIKTWDVSNKLKLNSVDLVEKIHKFRIENDIDLGIVKVFQFRAIMNWKPFT